MSLLVTKKVYYDNYYKTCHSTKWQRREGAVIAIDESIAFAEGGGQLGDKGRIRQGAQVAVFMDTQKYLGRHISRQDFPSILVENEIRLILEAPLDLTWDDTSPIVVEIDADYRAAISVSHTAAHLVYLGLLEVLGDVKSSVCGCHIEPSGGRFDLRHPALSVEQLTSVVEFVDSWRAADFAATLEALPGEPECLVWSANAVRIPCGGTHVPRTGLVGPMTVRRRTKGKGIERIYYSIVDAVPSEFRDMYV